jgi:aminopeptidase N
MTKRLTGWIVVAMMTAFVYTLHAQSVFASLDRGRRSRSFDVLHYRIEVAFEEDQRKVIGTTMLRVHPLADGIDSVVLDAAELDVESVSVGKSGSAGFVNRSPELVVRLGRVCGVTDTLDIRVMYSCTPKKGLYFIQPDSSHPRRHRQIWTQGEDMDNHYWFPCYDFPNSKGTSEVIATVREDYTLLSNGRLVKASHDPNRKTRTFHWRQEKPHSSYLIMLVAGDYHVTREMYGKIPLLYYVYPEDSSRVHLIFGRTSGMMKFFEEKIGERYPWDQYAQVIIDDFMWGGMENTSATTMNTSLVVDERSVKEMSPDPTVAHELAHQWWGDLVTCRDWQHLWLNEGFATYFEKMYDEYADGTDAFQFAMMEMSRAVRSSDRVLGRKPIVSRESHETNVYSRGAWVLHMLRDVVGERPFWNGLREYLRRHKYANAETHEFELALEDATGQNLEWFFYQWVQKAGFPQLEVKKEWNEQRGMLSVTITQTQPQDSLTGIFKFPLNMEFSGDGWKMMERIWVERAESTYAVHLPKEPQLVIADRGFHVLKDLKFEKPKEEYLYALSHSDDVSERIRSMVELQGWPDDGEVVAALRRAARSDMFWGVRRLAVEGLGRANSDSVRESLMQVAKNDPDGRVRAAAVGGLRKYQGAEVAEFVEQLAGGDSSYLVVSACLYALIGVDSLRAEQLARRCLAQESYRDYVRLSAIGALRTLGGPEAVSSLLPYTAPSYSVDVRSRATTVIGDLGRGNGVAEQALGRLLNDGERNVRSAVVRALVMQGGELAKVLMENRLPIEMDGEIRGMIENGLKAEGVDLPPEEK